MLKKKSILPKTFFYSLFGIFIVLSLTGCGSMAFMGVLNPKGPVAYEQRELLFDSLALMMIVVLPVIIMSLAFVFHYQASHRVRDYKPNWSHNYFLEAVWWTVPCIIILILGIMTWQETHRMDPYKPLAGDNQPPLVIEAIALPWKWLFIYPQQNIATINYVEIPVGQQIEFLMTNDNVAMSAFAIPQLGSQIYTMAGMRTRLHLLGDKIGVYDGLNTQYNGDGFSDMHFQVHVVTADDMQQWLATVTKSPALTADIYQQLLNPSVGDKPRFFNGVPANFFQNVINTYMQTTGPVDPHANQIQQEG